MDNVRDINANCLWYLHPDSMCDKCNPALATQYESPTICSWNLVEFSIETDAAIIQFDRETAIEIYRNLGEFLEDYKSAG